MKRSAMFSIWLNSSSTGVACPKIVTLQRILVLPVVDFFHSAIEIGERSNLDADVFSRFKL
jgi:hypothetical protein